ncbi:MAG: hypothetical protein M3Y53_04275, partial [Thermoproteota archaeon]|nr:hypothetical protein [Thermoproteota archaeon]
PLEVLLIGGVPLNETISLYGSFVIDAQEEIHPAIEDYRSGKVGKLISKYIYLFLHNQLGM